MYKTAVVLAFFAEGHGWRVQPSTQLLKISPEKGQIPFKLPDSLRHSQSLAEVTQSPRQASTSKLKPFWQSGDVERALTLLFIIAIGKVLQARFPQKEPMAVQKLLLQFLLPATLFQGLSKQKIEASHMIYFAGGAFLVLVRLLTGTLVSYAVFGQSCHLEHTKLRRTALFSISSLAPALSVFPFVSEFVGAEYVGLGAMVDIPMKVYILILMPIIFRKLGEKTAMSSKDNQEGNVLGALALLLKDPMTLSVIFGIIWAVVTGGGGTECLGFAGQAIDALARGQTPCLFLLIGLNLTFASASPLFCVVLLLASQGVLLIMVWLLLLVMNPGDTYALFIILFAQGAPMFAVSGIMAAAVDSGFENYTPTFVLDIMGIAYPLNSVMQCLAGVMGASYQPLLGVFGAMLITIAALLRIVFRTRFQAG
mmetsp:Transcript_46036/g.81682  ORF Transcript_46036/g.81682 Transcript_46036/m.81682 type:complete len:424 (-) Transcript_46036:121-1392(-)